jgi:hypothetical protein
MSNASRWPAARHSRAMHWGIAVSLLLHAALLQMFLHHDAAPPAAARSRFADMTLFLLPAPQPRLALAQVQPMASIAPQAARRNAHTAPRSGNKNETVQLPPTTESAAIHPAPQEQPAAPGARPRLDLDAALKMAGKMAKDPNSLYDDRAVAQLKTHPLEGNNPDSRLAQGIKSSARADCINADQPGNLLTPLFLLADAVLSKKDAGCKW